MHLLERDVLRLLSQIPYLTIGKQASAKTFITAMVRDGEELNAILMQFPEVQYEPLDQHYELLKCMGALSEELVSDLCTDYTWCGVVWAAWLVALAPAPQYRAHLASAHAGVSRHNQWLVELALGEIDSTTWQPDIELQALVQRLRTLLSRISPPKIALRRVPNAQQLALAEVERQKVVSAYHSGGLDATLTELKRSQAVGGDYGTTIWQWDQNQSPHTP